MSVGRSSRTPVKHYLLDAMLGKVCGVLSLSSLAVPCRATHKQPIICVDLCGGDGLKNDLHDASPLIMYKHCKWLTERGKAAKLEVIEKMPNTFEQLEINTGFMSREIATTTLGDSSLYRLPKLSETQAAFIHCDPNNVDQIPLTRPFVGGFNRYTTYLVTLGCNVGGLKMCQRDKRSGWFDYVVMLVDVLPRHHDAILFWLNQDSSQWAYLLSIPRVWSEKFTNQAVTWTSDRWTHGVSAVSYRKDAGKFNDQVSRLFLTKEEYANRST